MNLLNFMILIDANYDKNSYKPKLSFSYSLMILFVLLFQNVDVWVVALVYTMKS